MGAETYPIQIEDLIRTYAALPEERGELMLKEIGDAVRMMAPMSAFLASPMDPLKWINDTKGKATVNLRTEGGELHIELKADLS